MPPADAGWVEWPGGRGIGRFVGRHRGEGFVVKLAKLRLENFRHLGDSQHPLELDFTDALGRVRDFTLLVGPNTSGKTTILDAIAAALAPGLGMPTLRPGFNLSPRT